MKLVIDIPDNIYVLATRNTLNASDDVIEAIANGIILKDMTDGMQKIIYKFFEEMGIIEKPKTQSNDKEKPRNRLELTDSIIRVKEET